MNLATSKSNKITAEAKFKSEGGMSAEIMIVTSALLVGLFIRKSDEMVSFLKYVISACDLIFISVAWWDTDALTFLYP
jgi:hypothetical protein